jgi:hypothetical protein
MFVHRFSKNCPQFDIGVRIQLTDLDVTRAFGGAKWRESIESRTRAAVSRCFLLSKYADGARPRKTGSRLVCEALQNHILRGIGSLRASDP